MAQAMIGAEIPIESVAGAHEVWVPLIVDYVKDGAPSSRWKTNTGDRVNYDATGKVRADFICTTTEIVDLFGVAADFLLHLKTKAMAKRAIDRQAERLSLTEAHTADSTPTALELPEETPATPAAGAVDESQTEPDATEGPARSGPAPLNLMLDPIAIVAAGKLDPIAIVTAQTRRPSSLVARPERLTSVMSAPAIETAEPARVPTVSSSQRAKDGHPTPAASAVKACAAARRAAVKAYIDEVWKKRSKRLTHADIWKAARYKTRSSFERWLRCDTSARKAAAEAIERVLSEKPHLK